jgi:hypothetical protein
MSATSMNPMKRFLFWLSGAPVESVQAQPFQAPAVDATASSPVEAPPVKALVPEEAAAPAPAGELATEAAPAPTDAAPPTAQETPLTGASTHGSPTATAIASANQGAEDRTGSTTMALNVPEPLNDATAYDVSIVQADVPDGTLYWQAVLVHHLAPEENHGSHHIFLDALDEQGARIVGAQGRITWEGGEHVVTVDKPVHEPGTNFPMWKWQLCTVEMLGLPSDRVTGLHTGHPDETPGVGNTLFHHSFAVTFQRGIKGRQAEPGAPPASAGAIIGTVRGAAGKSVLLTLEGEIVARQTPDATGVYRFGGLAAGDYVVVVEGTETRSEAVSVDGQSETVVDLAVATAGIETSDKVIDRYFLFGAPSSARTAVYLDLARGYLLAHQPTFGFRVEDALHAWRVVLMGGVEDIPQATEDALVQAGCQVRRLQGTPQQIQDGLQQLDDGGHQVFLPTTPLGATHA